MKTFFIATAFAALLLPGVSIAKVRVVCSTTDIASIAGMVAGDLAKVESIAKGTADPHYVEVLPSYMIKVKKAAVYFKVGLSLDRWADYIIDGARNGNLVVVDCSKNITPLNVPTKVDASMGDVHPNGNPHYWLDPDNGVIIARTIADALAGVDPDHAADYNAGFDRFVAELKRRREALATEAQKLSGIEIVAFHDSWPYLEHAFGFTVAGHVEPKPGIEPTPSHTASIVNLIKSRRIKVVGVEPYFSRRAPEVIASETGAHVVEMPTSVGGAPGADNYFSLFDVLVKRIAEANGG